jgi:N-acetylneuraminate synthase
MRDYQGEYLIMQCTSSYPVEPKNVGMTYFQEIINTTGSVGLSDHTGNPMVSMAAIAMQASMVEFHVVFSKKQFGPDSSSSITFQDALTISQFRDIWCDIFDLNYDKDLIAKKLEDTRIKFGRGLSLKRDLKKGELVKEDLFTLKKPQGPLNWMQRSQFYGLRASRDLNSNQHLAINDFE